MNTQIGVPTWVSGVVVAVLTWLVIIGGIKSIGRAFEKLAPAKVRIYLVGSLVVIVTFAAATAGRPRAGVSRSVHDALGDRVRDLRRDPLRPGARAVRERSGVRNRGSAYGTAQTDRPSQQGLNGVMETFIVSFGTCTLTALTVLLSGVIDWSCRPPSA